MTRTEYKELLSELISDLYEIQNRGYGSYAHPNRPDEIIQILRSYYDLFRFGSG